VDEAESFRLLDAAFDAGLTFIDTADVYSRWARATRRRVGDDPRQVVCASGKRGGVTLATKVGMDMATARRG